MSDQSAKQQIVDKLRDVDTVLVTVNSSPTVDELSAALGFTLLINKLNKHATAVFSGDIPPAITFLDPEKTFENSVNSLRDFIIALDKEKADHLRYKVDGDMVKIFITPYRTTIDDSDLEFSQGDYNVEMVVALGVRNNDDLDRALIDHGRIMHDATVASLSLGKDSSDLGSLNWHEDDASSYSEMLVSLSEALRNDKNLIDEQIATAFLTGIVAATDRFSNASTSSKVMTMAAQLMAAGANQQLIASKLEDAQEITQPPADTATRNDGTTDLSDKASGKIDKSKPKQDKKPPKDKQAADGTMTISHEKKGSLEEVSDQYEQDNQKQATKQAEDALAQSLAASAPAAANNMPSVADLQNDIKQAAAEAQDDSPAPKQALAELPQPDPAAAQAQAPSAPAPEPPTTRELDMPQFEPTFGGTLNATSSQAADDKRRSEEADKNRQILSHDSGSYAKSEPEGYPALNSFNQPEDGQPTYDPMNSQPQNEPNTHGHDLQPLSQPSATAASGFAPSAPATSAPTQTLADLDREHRAPAASDDAQSAIEAALSNAQPMSQQQAQIPTMPSPDPNAAAAPAPQGSDAPGGLPPLPPMPDFSTLPPLPSSPGAPSPTPPSDQPDLPTVSPVNAAPQAQATPPPQPNPSDPGQFQIPGQS